MIVQAVNQELRDARATLSRLAIGQCRGILSMLARAPKLGWIRCVFQLQQLQRAAGHTALYWDVM
jgi:hypothetical protein